MSILEAMFMTSFHFIVFEKCIKLSYVIIYILSKMCHPSLSRPYYVCPEYAGTHYTV